MNDPEVDWNNETQSLPSNSDSIDEPMPLIRYGGMDNLSEIFDDIDRISPLLMPSPIHFDYEPMPLIRYGGMENLSHIPDDIDRISPLSMSIPMNYNEDSNNPSIYSRVTEEFDQDEYILILEEIGIIEEEIRRLEQMAEFFHVAQNVMIYEPTVFQNETQTINQNGTLDRD